MSSTTTTTTTTTGVGEPMPHMGEAEEEEAEQQNVFDAFGIPYSFDPDGRAVMEGTFQVIASRIKVFTNTGTNAKGTWESRSVSVTYALPTWDEGHTRIIGAKYCSIEEFVFRNRGNEEKWREVLEAWKLLEGSLWPVVVVFSHGEDASDFDKKGVWRWKIKVSEGKLTPLLPSTKQVITELQLLKAYQEGQKEKEKSGKAKKGAPPPPVDDDDDDDDAPF